LAYLFRGRKCPKITEPIIGRAFFAGLANQIAKQNGTDHGRAAAHPVSVKTYPQTTGPNLL